MKLSTTKSPAIFDSYSYRDYYDYNEEGALSHLLQLLLRNENLERFDASDFSVNSLQENSSHQHLSERHPRPRKDNFSDAEVLIYLKPEASGPISRTRLHLCRMGSAARPRCLGW